MLRLHQKLWNFILSHNLDDKNSYVATGFSGDGKMVGSDAIVWWFAGAGPSRSNKYHLGGKNPADLVPVKIDYNNPSSYTTQNRVYYAFQLETTQPSSYLLYAIGPKGVFPTDTNPALIQHIGSFSTETDYKKGTSVEIGSSITSNLNLRRSHGILNMMGWSLLMMIGAIISRYYKHWDPTWLYMHTSIQAFAFVLGVVGILIESKIRKYWNWYHHYVGRILIFFAVVNTFNGLHLGGDGSMWFGGYAIALAILFIAAVILEIRQRMKSKEPTLGVSHWECL